MTLRNSYDLVRESKVGGLNNGKNHIIIGKQYRKFKGCRI